MAACGAGLRIVVRGALVIGPLGGLLGCRVPAPEPEAVLAMGLETPEGAFETFRTAVQGNLLEQEYLCFSLGFLERNDLTQLRYREFRDELIRRQGYFRYAVYKARITRVDRPSPTEAFLVATSFGRVLEFQLVREDFWEIRMEGELHEDDVARDLVEEGILQIDNGRLWGSVPADSDLDLERLSALNIGREWKIDDFRIVDEDERPPPPPDDEQDGPQNESP